MFKKATAIITAIVILLFFIACGDQSSHSSNSANSQSSYKELIDQLQSKLSELQSSYSDLNDEAYEKIQELEAEIESIKLQAEASTTTQAITTAPKTIYRYKIKEGKAIITGLIGDTDNLMIPSIVDGFEVYGIDEKAFAASKIKSVVISDGIESIDWFAFSGANELSSVTIPKSVTKIGYGAFDGVPKTFTIYCYKDSFAEAFAKSYGFAYAFI